MPDRCENALKIVKVRPPSLRFAVELGAPCLYDGRLLKSVFCLFCIEDHC
jgi:hypothetical protein